MKFGLVMLLLLSLPEVSLNTVLILLFCERKPNLMIKKENILRFFAVLIFILIGTWGIRSLVPNLIFSVAYQILMYVVLIVVIYRINGGIVFLSVTSATLYTLTIENMIIPFVITYITKGMDAFYDNYTILLLTSIPIRVMQFAAIWFIWKHSDLFIITKLHKRFRIIFAICNFVVIITEVIFLYMYIYLFDSLSVLHQILFAAGIFSLVTAFNVTMITFLCTTVKGVVLQGYHQYQKLKVTTRLEMEEFEDNAISAFSTIYDLLKSNRNVEEAICLLEEILDKEDGK